MKLRCIYTLFISLALLGCFEQKSANSGCQKKSYYSIDFLLSDFYQGWGLLKQGLERRECRKAIPFFLKSVRNNHFAELSALYYHYCSFPEHSNMMEQSSIYHARNLADGISEDEFKWIVNFALCDSVVEQYALGKMLYDGFILTQNTRQGLHFLTLAAKKDYLLAQYKLVQAHEERGEKALAKSWRKKIRESLAKY